ncbi:MAG: acyltransferase [Acidimicrobiales bacterium]|nr:acyltransferase [Acidimicrobiales bacterium]
MTSTDADSELAPAPSMADQPPAVGVARGQRLRLTYQPALDGIRGLGLFFVMASHSGFDGANGAGTWAQGGFFWVSTFFTLSGFLITSLLIQERAATGAISLSAFWSRRFRRLMPGALLALAAVVAFGATIADSAQLQRLRGDGLAALFYVANWRFIVDRASYADLFASPSPVQHFWTLSIEEQFYLLFPVALGILILILRRSWRTIGLVVGALTVVAIGWMIHLRATGARIDRLYFGTDTRLPELTIGVLLAIGVDRWKPHERPSVQRMLRATGIVALGIILMVTVTVQRTASWLYSGGFAVYALVSAILIVSVIQPRGVARALLSFRPLRWLGQLSYSGYLFHWPLFLWLDGKRLGLEHNPYRLFAVRLAATLVVAAASHYLIEHPIRVGRRLRGRTPWIVAPSAFAAVAVGFVAVTWNLPAPTVDLGAPPDAEAGKLWRPMPVDDSGKPRILIVGDSQAYVLGKAIERWADRTGEAVAWNVSLPGCGIVRGGTTTLSQTFDGDCGDWEPRWADQIQSFDPDVVVVHSGGWDWIPRTREEWGGERKYGDPVFDDYLVAEYSRATRLLASGGARVVWLTSPCYEMQSFAEDPTHLDTELLPRVQADNAASMTLIDFFGYLCPDGKFTRELFGFADARPDGAHLSEAAADHVAEWLGPQLLAVAH